MQSHHAAHRTVFLRNDPQDSPQESRALATNTYSDSEHHDALSFSACANGKSGFFRSSTAAWYRWDFPIPFEFEALFS